MAHIWILNHVMLTVKLQDFKDENPGMCSERNMIFGIKKTLVL